MIITCLRRKNVFAGAARATNTSSLRELSASGGQEARMHLLAGPPEDFTTNPLRLPSMQKDAPAPLALKMPRRYYSTPPRAQPQTEAKPRQKTTVLKLQRKYRTKKPITMLTCYDYPTATIVDEVGVDIVLVGDSSGMVVHGHDTTLPVSMEDIESHTRAVRRGAPNTFVIGDMPFGSFEVSPAEAVRNAVRLIKAGADAVKLEGGARMAETSRAIVNAGILVQGHIGLTPQTAAAMGGFRVQGKSCAAATELLEDAKALQEAGCFCIVIEGVPSEVAEYVTRNIEVMTIGIGAGKETSGQVLVLHDMMGLNPGRTPKFCKKYGDVTSVIKGAVQSYVDEVSAGTFPSPEYCYNMPEAESAKMKAILADTATSA